MRVIMFDIDTLRPDHLGCYGYGRDTSPAIDSVAREGVRFDNYYCPNAPCLPSRASLITGRYGIRNGVLGHGGTAADLRLQGETRHFRDECSENGLFMQFRQAGMHTASFSTFAERHSAWWFNAGFNECFNVGKCRNESAEEVTPHVLDWLRRRGGEDNWFLHVHYWDPHTPYRAPAAFGYPYEDVPLPDNWITQEIFDQHLLHVGPHGANEINMWDDAQYPQYPRHPGCLKSLDNVKAMIDSYDYGVRWTDDNIAQILDQLKDLGVYEDTAVIITSDHGENFGELGLYGEHGTADEPTCHIPMIIKWPGGMKGHVDSGFHDNVDLAPTVQELLGTSMRGGYDYDGQSYAPALLKGEDCARDSVVLTQCCHVCQRSARFDDYLYIRTVHGGYHLFPKEMLFDVKNDPHQLHNLAEERPDLCDRGARLLLNWTEDMMKKSDFEADPMWTVMREGGPEHARGMLESYIQRLEGTPRADQIPLLREQYPKF
ncbi:MAG: sulfatase [Acutalibacter sp.]|nr:sulfatase [Acutalibacter sp.]